MGNNYNDEQATVVLKLFNEVLCEYTKRVTILNYLIILITNHKPMAEIKKIVQDNDLWSLSVQLKALLNNLEVDNN